MFIAVIVPGGRPSLTSSGQKGAPVASETIFLKNATDQWQSYDGTNLAPYLANVDGAQTTAIALDVLQQTDLTGMSGAQFLVGYGLDAEEMLRAQRYRAMYQVP